MNYYYDLTLNFSTDNLYDFYEWELKDNLTEIKKIPLIRIDKNNLVKFYTFNGVINEELLKKIKDRTTYKHNGKINTISYSAIFTDTKFAIALIFNKNGSIISRSNLMLEDELNIIEIGYSLRKEKTSFIKQDRVVKSKILRQEQLMKNVIKKEIEKSYKEKNDNKLIYYHLEWFNNYNNDIKQIYTKMIEELNKEYINNLDKIYNLVLYCSA